MSYDRFLVLEEMARQRISMPELAEKTELSTRGLSKMLGPSGNPTADTLGKIAKALNTSVAVFFADDQNGGSENENPVAQVS